MIVRTAALLLTASLTSLFAAGPAHASTPDGYDTLCVSATLPAGQTLPKICLPDPLP